MITRSSALADIPAGLRNPLLEEYDTIIRNYRERKWSPSELAGGRFCEIVYTILEGHAKGVHASKPAKPKNLVDACRKLEGNSSVPRSFQILIPRLLPALYEIRNNRNVGHVGGDVDPNHMDALAVVSISSWIMAELVRVFHKVSVDEARVVVDNLVERRVPLVWSESDLKRVLDPRLGQKAEVLLLLASTPGVATVDDLVRWTDTTVRKKGYFIRFLRRLHKERLIEFSEPTGTVRLLPPGVAAAERVTQKH